MSQVDYSKHAIIERLDELEEGADGDTANLADVQVGLLYAALTAAAEVANVRNVTIQVKDFLGANVEAACKFHCQLFDANMLPAVTASWRLAEAGAGTEISVTAKASLIIQTGVAGTATLTVTDVGGAANATVYLKVSPLNSFGRDEYVALAFDNA